MHTIFLNIQPLSLWDLDVETQTMDYFKFLYSSLSSFTILSLKQWLKLYRHFNCVFFCQKSHLVHLFFFGKMLLKYIKIQRYCFPCGELGGFFGKLTGRKRQNPIMNVSGISRVLHLHVWRSYPPITYIVANIIIKQHCVLGYHTNTFSQWFLLDL